MKGIAMLDVFCWLPIGGIAEFWMVEQVLPEGTSATVSLVEVGRTEWQENGEWFCAPETAQVGDRRMERTARWSEGLRCWVIWEPYRHYRQHKGGKLRIS